MAKSKATIPADAPKELSLQMTIAGLEKKFGKGIIITEQTDFTGVEKFSSGILGLDKILGGGYARGRLVEIYGPESSGKTTLALHAVAERQKYGEVCAFVDIEHAIDLEYAANLGVQPNKLLLSQPDSGEQALDVVEMLVRSSAVDLIILDSVAALVPQAELEGDMSSVSMGTQAKLMSKACRKLVGICNKTGTTIIFINQIRMKIGVMFGSPETVTGGNALKFYASQRIDIRRKEVLKKGDEPLGCRTQVKTVKNKIFPPFRIAQFNIDFGEGVNWARDLLDRAVEDGYVDKAGAWYSLPNGERLGQGADNATQAIKDDEELANKLKGQLTGTVKVQEEEPKESNDQEHTSD